MEGGIEGREMRKSEGDRGREGERERGREGQREREMREVMTYRIFPTVQHYATFIVVVTFFFGTGAQIIIL